MRVDAAGLGHWVHRAAAWFDGMYAQVASLSASSVPGIDRTGGRRLAVLPAGDETVASARLRSLPLLSLTEKGSILYSRSAGFLLSEIPDILWIQKRLTSSHLRIARALKERGSSVVYDCDESGPDLDRWAKPDLVKEMLRLADVVTTDTPERAERLRQVAPSFRTEVLENQLDYADQLPTSASPRVRADSGELRVLWFGYGENLRSLSAYVDVLYSLGGVRMILCGPRRSDRRSVFGHLPVEAHRWSRAGFVEVLRSCDVTVLSHFGSRDDEAKSAHKMVTSICHGVPALVSATPDYGRVAELAGIGRDGVYSSSEELARLLERMRSAEVRQAYIDQARPRLLGRYGAGAFASAAGLLLGGISSSNSL